VVFDVPTGPGEN